MIDSGEGISAFRDPALLERAPGAELTRRECLLGRMGLGYHAEAPRRSMKHFLPELFHNPLKLLEFMCFARERQASQLNLQRLLLILGKPREWSAAPRVRSWQHANAWQRRHADHGVDLRSQL
jgi:hypothetical protein